MALRDRSTSIIIGNDSWLKSNNYQPGLTPELAVYTYFIPDSDPVGVGVYILIKLDP